MKPSFETDNRAQSIQLGFLLVVAIMLISMSIYQADVVPGQNQAVEQGDYQTARGDLIEMSNTIYTSGVQGTPSAITFQAGTQYDSRFFFQNPSNPHGTLRTNSTGAYQVSNAVAIDDNTADYWDGTRTWQATTNDIVFTPNYNEITREKHYITGGGVAYIDNENKYVLRQQSVVSDTEISIMSVTGNLDASGTSVGLTVEPIATQTREITVTDSGNPVTITIPTKLSPTAWENKIASEEMVANGGHIQDVQASPEGVEVVLEQGEYYTLIVNEVTVSESKTSQTTDRLEPVYTTAVTDTNSSVDVDEQQEIRAEVRSKFNTPVSNEPITTEVVSGSSNVEIVRSNARTNANGQAQAVIKGTQQGEATVRMYFDDASTPTEYADYTVTVGGDGGSTSLYTVSWDNPSTIAANNDAVTDCTDSKCTWDPSKSSGQLTLRSSLDPSVTGMNIDFGVNNTAEGTLTTGSADTDTAGEAETILENQVDYGAVKVYAATSGSNDVITINIDDDALNSLVASYSYSPTDPEDSESITFDASSSYTIDSATITSYEWDWTSDGTYDSTGQTTTHTYSTGGTYDVTLRTTDSRGETSTQTQTVTVNSRPNPSFTASPDPANVGDTVSFDGSNSNDPDGTIMSYEWDLNGDGTYDTNGETTTRTYSTSGSYDVTLRTTDDEGSTDTITQTVRVRAAPTVDSVSAVQGTQGNKATLDVDWVVSDADNNLDTVLVEMRNDRTGSVEATKTVTVTGGNDSGTTSLVGSKKNRNDPYTAIVTVTDADGLEDTGTN